jgi:alpha-L-arabinofuranosidase
MNRLKLPLAAAMALLAPQVLAQDASIRVDASRVLNRVSPLLYGSCIEDVNHEIYGGLYDQKLFGESFEEPPRAQFQSWTTLGGRWRAEEGAARVDSDAGAKLVLKEPAWSDGSAEAEIRFPNGRGDNAGLLVRVSNAGVGADNFDGYEISLRPEAQQVILGRHRHDWTPLAQAPSKFDPNTWTRLRVQVDGARIRVFVGNSAEPSIDFTDAAPLPRGRVAVRTWNSDAAFRNVRAQGKARGFEVARGQDVSGMWDAIRTGNARAEFEHDSINPYNGARAQMLHHSGGAGHVGIANRGLNRWGIAVSTSQVLAGRLYLRAADLRGAVTLALQSADGTRTYATQKISSVTRSWQRYNFSLRPSATDSNARFVVSIERSGTLWIDQATLGGTGAARFQNLPIRADIGRALQAQGLNFLRYGGTMVNAPEYRWKKMIGDVDRRPPYRGHWYPHSTNGFGIEDFLRFCEAAKFEPTFAINVEETAQDAADLVEYLNGPAPSTWGRRRAQNGHPQPYGVKYIELGNEEVIWADSAGDYDHYIERFQILREAMRAKDASLKFISAAWWRSDSPHMERVFKALNGQADYWDLHPWADDANSGRAVDALLTEVRAKFQKWNPASTMKVAILEENGNTHNMQRALGHATILNAVRRHGDFVLTSCPANALQPLGQNDNGWDQGQIFFTPAQVWGMPPFYAQAMASRNHQPLLVSSTCEGNSALDITATKSEDGKSLILHVVNTSAAPISTKLSLQDFSPRQPSARIEAMAAAPSAVNTPANPTQIQPRASTWAHRIQGGAASAAYEFPAHSFTILRFE